MKRQPVWHGTAQEASDLASAVACNCTCVLEQTRMREEFCAAHAMIDDQRTLDKLLFARFIAGRLQAQEFCVTRQTQAPAGL
jgi:hypothetical protein